MAGETMATATEINLYEDNAGQLFVAVVGWDVVIGGFEGVPKASFADDALAILTGDTAAWTMPIYADADTVLTRLPLDPDRVEKGVSARNVLRSCDRCVAVATLRAHGALRVRVLGPNGDVSIATAREQPWGVYGGTAAREYLGIPRER